MANISKTVGNNESVFRSLIVHRTLESPPPAYTIYMAVRSLKLLGAGGGAVRGSEGHAAAAAADADLA